MKSFVRNVCAAGLSLLVLLPAARATVLTNWAVAGTATQSSTLANPANPVAAKAIDGNHDGFAGNGSVAHTASAGSNEWWEVDLGALKPVGNIHLWLEQDCCFAFQENLNIIIYNDTNVVTRTALWQTNIVRSIGQARDFAFDIFPASTGRVVRVEHPSGTYANLALAEVEVFNLGNTNPPVVATNYIATSDLARWSVNFSRGLDPASATNAANYVLSNSVAAASLVLQPDGQTVLLALGNVIPGQAVSMTVSNVMDPQGDVMNPTNLTATVPSLSAPTNLVAIAFTNQISLAWLPSFGATGYQLNRGGVPCANVSVTNYTDTSVTAGSTYCYAVTATNATSVSPASSTVCTTVLTLGQTLVWDANTGASGVQDGNGTWNGTRTNWWSGSANVAWPDNNVATFGYNTTTNCTVTLSNDVAPTGITFNPAGGGTYTFGGSSGINCSNSPTITANVNAAINVVLKGPGGFVKAGTGNLTLSQVETCTGAVTVNGGTLTLTAGNSGISGLGSASSLNINNTAIVNAAGDNALFGYNPPSPTVTLATGGKLTCPANSIHIGLVTLLGGELAGGQNSTWGSWLFDNNLNAGGGVTSTISATGLVLPSGTIRTWTVDAGSTLKVTGTFRGTYGSPASNSGGLIKAGAGTLILAGASAYLGTTAVTNGTLLVNGSTGANTITVSSSGTLGGTGTIGGAVTNNGTLSPGTNGVGTLSSGAQTWNSGGSYLCEINSTNATGCDLLYITGTLNLQSTTTSNFIVKPVTLTPVGSRGMLSNFNKFTNHDWAIATASGGIANFATNKFSVDASSFGNDFSGGAFVMATNGNSLTLKYLAAPLVFPRFIGVPAVSAGALQLNATGGVGQAYVLLGATNLLPAVWTPLLTNFAGTNGAIQFTNLPATNSSWMFYRLTTP